MYRLLFAMMFVVSASTIPLSAQQLSLPFASPPYGKNGNLGLALEVMPTLDAIETGAFGIGLSAEVAPYHTSKYSIKGMVSYFHISAQQLFGSGTLSSIATSTGSTPVANIVDLMMTMRIYPTAQSINTFFVGLGLGASIFNVHISGAVGSPFASLSSNTVVQPEIQFETGYKMRVFRNFYVEPSANYLLVMPPPGLSFSANVPIYTFLTTNNPGLLSGIEMGLSLGLQY